MNEQQFRELSAARALHALSPDEEQSFSEALAAHPEWLMIVDEDRDTVAELGAATPEVAPPSAARGAILDMIARTPQFEAGAPGSVAAATPAAPASASAAPATPAPPVEPRADHIPELVEEPEDPEQAFTRSRRKAAWFGLAASIAVLLAIALALPVRGMMTPQDPVSVALQQVESASDARTTTVDLDGNGKATLHWSDSTQQAVFVADGMAAAPENHDYELWIVRGDTPISLGVMHADAKGSAAVLADGFEPGDALAVTVEDRGGSPTGAPTSDPVVVVTSA